MKFLVLFVTFTETKKGFFEIKSFFAGLGPWLGIKIKTYSKRVKYKTFGIQGGPPTK